MKTIKTNKNEYQLICGIEIHAELKTDSKMFCGCKNDPFGAKEPNIYTCPVCLGMPGGLPTANKKAIEWTIKVGLALKCKINLFSKFDRKNYFYPDLPKAYQISQYDIPFCFDGVLETSYGPVKITRIHLEEDTGKLLHKVINGKKVSLIDFNRSGVPLIEIVTEPEIYSPEQAKEYGKKIRQILRYLEVADCDMDQGGMRLEANISLAKIDQENLPNYKVEVKNINSFKFAEQAISFEMIRQAKILDNDEIPVQETRGWDSNKSMTFSQRSKEDAEDYRYFPDPDLPPIRFSRENVDFIEQSLPELPANIASRWFEEYKVEERYSAQLITDIQSANLIEESFNLLINDSLTPNQLASAIVNKKIDISRENKASNIITTFKSLFQLDDVSQDEILKKINIVLSQNSDAVKKFQTGETKVLGFFIGQTARLIGKKVDANLLSTLIIQELNK
ncbi:MAG: Asp-tRNA(Asn)/Glu-tRNA(Gln) amidotransferase subunit GatB [Pseudomonadales bacterium]|nr:Asp-tRNA(Asn)/Glu-tRNA(Gln) amidotransferase subunit GatB [Pseudomonadales bacterium]